MTKQEFDRLPEVRVFSMAGPCLRFYRLVRENAKSTTVAFRNGDGFSFERKPRSWVHREPCSSCTDHQATQYPNGYLD